MSDAQVDRAVRALERIALALAAVYADQMEEKKLPAKAKRLSQLGFSNVQIAAALGSTPNSINVALHMARKRKANRARSKRAGKAQ